MASQSSNEQPAKAIFGEEQEIRDPGNLDIGSEVGISENTSLRIRNDDINDEPDKAADDGDHMRFLAAARDQDDLERDIGRQADQLLTEQADERDNRRLVKTEAHRRRLTAQLKKLDQRLSQPGGSATKNLIRSEKANLEAQIKNLDQELQQIHVRIEDRHKDLENGGEDSKLVDGDGQLPNETRREYLIRTGKITPFSKMAQVPKTSSDLADIMLDAEEEAEEEEEEEEEGNAQAQEETMGSVEGPKSHRNLMRPGFEEHDSSDDMPTTEPAPSRAGKRRRIQTRVKADIPEIDGMESNGFSNLASEDDFAPGSTDGSSADSDGSQPSDFDYYDIGDPDLRVVESKSKRKHKTLKSEKEDLTGVDDGDERVYQIRVQTWSRRRLVARQKAQVDTSRHESHNPEWQQPHPTRPDAHFDEGFRIPGDIYPSLFDYQKTGVRWLWELYGQQVGGIIGDEMGLGKTIQIISFLAGLHYSGRLSRPVIVVAPATVMKQWVNEFHRWWPPLRVSILHTSGSGMLDLRRESQWEDDLELEEWDESRPRKSSNQKAAKRIVDRVIRDGHVLVTTYSGLQTYADLLIPTEWQYAVLDEGHKIRNPNTAITIYCKELRTPNRLILSGTPMQNNLIELWSLFDFVFPMRLGTLVSFRQQFEFPIKQGGYANASNLQVETAMRCAETLKETISPYLLQRFKVDVAADLPKKSERVLFCKLTGLQRSSYQFFLESDEMKAIYSGRRQALYGVDILRKLCNHPDLVEHKTLSKKAGYDYGSAAKSGKMQVVKALLELWKNSGHKTLLFAQHRIMLDILEKFLRSSLEGFRYRRMDGNTSIKERQNLVDEFNRDPDLHVFLLTTKVGGLGINLTGADRVIIYDPDWNPSTDIQARERAWRLGQKREVEIYRLMTAGTIEEKIYHRQIFKQFLTNKILKDPKQRQTFHLSDLHDLFTLADPSNHTETSSLFKGTEVRFSSKDNKTQRKPKADSSSQPLSTATEGSNLKIISDIARQEDYLEAKDHSLTKNGSEDADQKPDRLLSVIFSRSGVQSAHEHDAILASNRGKSKVRADPEIITQEAKRVAAQAARELQIAGEVARTIPAGVPTWTGVVGTAGRPEERSRFSVTALGRGGFSAGRGRGGPSSSSVLANLSNRQAISTIPGNSGSNSSSRASTPLTNQVRGKDFLAMIRDFLMTHGGSCYTQMLIDHFNRYCGTPQRTAEFKEMLKRIAVLEKGGRGRGRWVLKKEFGGTAG